jgi:DNA-binding FadR family transcriptional regulator
MIPFHSNKINGVRARLPDLVTAQVLELIVAGELNPCDPIPSEADLARLFDVSKPVVREALGQLSGLGLVQIHQGRVTTIRAPHAEPIANISSVAAALTVRSQRDLVDMFALMAAESLRAAATCENAEKRRALLTRADVTDDLAMDPAVEVDFWYAVTGLGGSTVMSLFLNGCVAALRQALDRARAQSAGEAGRIDGSLADNRWQMATAIAAGNSAEAQAGAARHAMIMQPALATVAEHSVVANRRQRGA